MPRPRFGRWLVAVLLLGVAAAAPAQTSLTWTGGGGSNTNWTNAANWGGSGYPNNGQPNPGDTYNATMNSGTATLDADITVNNLTLNSATVGGGANLTVNGLFSSPGGAMQGAGTVTLNGGASMTSLTLNRALVNAAGSTATLNGNAFTSSTNGTWTNQAGATFVLANSSFIINSTGGAGTFINNGTFQRTGASFNTSRIDWAFNNAGTVNVTGGTVNFVGGGTDTGSYAVSSGATLNFAGGVRMLNGPVTGDGFVHVGTIYGGITPTVTVGGPANAYAVTGDTSINTGGLLAFNSPASTGTLSMAGGTLDGSAAFTANGLFSWFGGNLGASTSPGPGTLILNGGATMSGSLLNLNRAVVNAAGSTATFSGANLYSLSANASWTNQPGATFTLSSNGGLSLSGGTGTFTNNGTFQKTGGTGTSTVAWAFNNAGTINVTSGTISFTGPGTESGTANLSVGTGATLQFSTGTTTWTDTAGSSGAGLVAFSTGSAVFNGSHTLASRVNLLAGTVDGTGSLAVSGLFTWFGGTMQGTGTTTLSGGANLAGTGTINRTLVNANGSTATFTTTGGLSAASASAAWINQAGATFTFAVNDSLGSAVTGAGTFANAGVFQKTGGTGTSQVSWNFSNTGTVIGSSGTLSFDAFPTNTFTVSNAGTIVAGGANPGVINFGLAANLTNYSQVTHTLTGGTWQILGNGTVSFISSRPIATLAAGTTVELNGPGSAFAALENHVTANAGSLSILGGRAFTPGGVLANTGTLTVGQAAGDGSQFTGGVTVAGGGILRGTGTVAPPAGSTVAVNSGGTIMGGSPGAAGVLAVVLPAGQDLALSGTLAVPMSGTVAPDVNGLSVLVSRISLSGGGLSLSGASLTLDFSGIGTTGGVGDDPSGNGNGFWTDPANDNVPGGMVWRMIDAGTDETGSAPAVTNANYAAGSFSSFIGTGGPLSLTGGGDPGAVYLAFTPTAVPEPSTLLLVGGAGLATVVWRRTRQPKIGRPIFSEISFDSRPAAR
jgi:hypothetical protein